jgi:hypothetical protein
MASAKSPVAPLEDVSGAIMRWLTCRSIQQSRCTPISRHARPPGEISSVILTKQQPAINIRLSVSVPKECVQLGASNRCAGCVARRPLETAPDREPGGRAGPIIKPDHCRTVPRDFLAPDQPLVTGQAKRGRSRHAARDAGTPESKTRISSPHHPGSMIACVGSTEDSPRLQPAT